MTKTIFVFDMDGVLLEPGGYQQALKSTVKLIGKMLGAPETRLTGDQIARFEALNVSNEWDSLAICTAIILLHVWKIDPDICLNGAKLNSRCVTDKRPDFDNFLSQFTDIGDLPGQMIFHKIIATHPDLHEGQKQHLADILLNSNDIYQSLTLPLHQEAVLGSTLFQKIYGIEPQLECESALLKHDRPSITCDQREKLLNWLDLPENHAVIMTNRLSLAPEGYQSTPEAELGLKLVGLESIPLIGSGTLLWFAAEHCGLASHTFLKPNPVHALTALGLSHWDSAQQSVAKAADLWLGKGNAKDWQAFNGAKLVIFEDSANGILAGIRAVDILKNNGIEIDLKRVGVSQNKIKLDVLKQLSDLTVPDINHIDWTTITSETRQN